MALTVFYTPRWRAIDANGDPLPNAVLEFFEAGTSTPLPVYADVDGNTALGVTVTSDLGGLFPEMFMLPQAYDINLYDENAVLVWSGVDWFPPQAASASSVSLLAVAGVTFAAGETAYMSDGSGGLNAGQMYKGDADLEYASNSPWAFFAPGAVTIGATGLFTSEGSISGLSGLTPGARYYMSGTAGAISVTPGTFPRVVGQARSTTELAIATNPPLLPDVDARIKAINDFRLTLTTGVPVTPTDVTAAGTLFWTPYISNKIALYTGSRWVVMTSAQLSVAVPAVANQVYDVFVDYNDGTPQLVLLAWTNDTTRATALAEQDEVLVKTGDTQQRYVGTVRTATASQLNDSAAMRHVWNYYNRVPRSLQVLEATASWTYTTATVRQANGAAGNQVDLVCGVQEVLMTLTLKAEGVNDGGAFISVGIGEDSTTTYTDNDGSRKNGTDTFPIVAPLVRYPAIGRHFYSWNEWSTAAGTTTWYGTNAAGANCANGIRGWWAA